MRDESFGRDNAFGGAPGLIGRWLGSLRHVAALGSFLLRQGTSRWHFGGIRLQRRWGKDFTSRGK